MGFCWNEGDTQLRVYVEFTYLNSMNIKASEATRRSLAMQNGDK